MSDRNKELQCCVSKCENPLDAKFWNSRWENNEIGWDIGVASPAITKYMDQYLAKNAKILIPGCGNAHEAEYLVANGFTNITLVDIAPKAVELLNEKFANTPNVKVLCKDFFLHEGHYDLIIEQTFFCTLPLPKRNEYAFKTASLLNKNGRIIGLLFDKTFEHQGPPFGGSVEDYKPIFETNFVIKTMEKCYNSIAPRVNSEIFINLVKT